MKEQFEKLVALVAEINNVLFEGEEEITVAEKDTAETLTAKIVKATRRGKLLSVDAFKENEENPFFSIEAHHTLESIDGITMPKLKKGKKVKGEKKERYTRSHALHDAIIAGPANKEYIVELSDKLYNEKNPENRAKEGKDVKYVPEAMFRYAMPSLLLFGVVNLSEEGIYTYSQPEAE